MVFVFSDSHFLQLRAQSHKLLSGEKQENNYLGPSSFKKKYSTRGCVTSSRAHVSSYFKVFVKLRSGSRSRSGAGQVKVRKVQFRPELYPIFGLFTQPPAPCTQPPAPPQTFSHIAASSLHTPISSHINFKPQTQHLHCSATTSHMNMGLKYFSSLHTASTSHMNFKTQALQLPSLSHQLPHKLQASSTPAPSHSRQLPQEL